MLQPPRTTLPSLPLGWSADRYLADAAERLVARLARLCVGHPREAALNIILLDFLRELNARQS